jgi:serine/threonine protein kinase
MAATEPNSRRTLAVLFGASSYRRSPKLAQGRAFYNSAQDLLEYLIAPEGLGLSRENINWLFDDSRSPSDQLQDIRDFLENRCRYLKNEGTEPQDLLLYYVGHGLFWGSDQTYSFAIRSTDEASEGLTGIRASDLASILKAHARFLRKFIILDCCFSAAAYKEFQSGPLLVGRVKLLEELPQRGTTLLCSASAHDASLSPASLSRTMFSNALLKVLSRGHPSLGSRLSLCELGDLIKVQIREDHPDTGVRPEIHSPDQREGDIAYLPVFPNPAYSEARQKAQADGARLEAEGREKGGAEHRPSNLPKETPRQIGKYEVLDVLGEGGMGVVYRAVDTSIGRTVAIKMMRGTYAEDQDLLARFHREVRSTATLQHKNIVTVYALDNFEGFPYMVMEYLEGQSMAEMISARSPLPIAEKIGLVCQVCEGLQYAHERNIIHRDIKPANILVLKDGVAKIVDFGIARAAKSDTLTQTGQVIGSIHYMSPEQISGGSVDTRTDIYSTGVMLYEFLTGELPFKVTDGDPHATLLKILNDPVPSLGRYLPDCPDGLDELVSKAMTKSAEERFQTAEDFGYELARLQETIKRGMTQEFLSKARMAIERKDWDLARQQLQEVLRYERRNSEANELFHIVRQEIQRQQRSIQIAQLRAQAQMALTNLQYEEAMECIELARRLDPEDKELIALSDSITIQVERARELGDVLRRGQAALYAGDLNEAEAAVKRVLETDQNHTEAKALENLVKKELEERKRRAQLQDFVKEARRQISNHDFLSALHSLQKAQAIDPGDSNIRELLNWAARGHAQEKLRTELQKHINEIGRLLGEDQYQDAFEACRAALIKFPNDPSLLQLLQLAERQLDLIARRLQVDDACVRARQLIDSDQHSDAIGLLEQALLSFPDEPNLETLLAITISEAERKARDKEERERQQQLLESTRNSAEQSASLRQEILDLLKAFQIGLAEKLPIPQLNGLAKKLTTVEADCQLTAEQSARYSAAFNEFSIRANRRKRELDELKELNRSIRESKGYSEIASLSQRARFLSEAYGNDDEVQNLYQEVCRFAETFKSKRDAVGTKISDLLRPIQASQNLASLLSMQRQMQEVAADWLDDAFIRSLVQQADTYVDEVRRNKEYLLSELNQIANGLPAARSAGQVRLLEEQARMLVADFQDTDVENAIRGLENTAKDRLRQIDGIVSKLKETAAQIATAQTLKQTEDYGATAEQLGLENCEEADELFRKIRHSVEERRREYRRIYTNLERLVINASKAMGAAELEVILARRRDLLKKYPEDTYFSVLETKLEIAVAERRTFLNEAAAKELEDVDDFTGDVNTNVEASPPEEVGEPVEQELDKSIQVKAKKRRRLLTIALPASVLVCLVVIVMFIFAPKTVPIRSIPSDAIVTIDGQACGAPCVSRLRSGKHQLDIAKSGFETLHQTIHVPWFGLDLPIFQLSTLAPSPPVPTSTTQPQHTEEKNARIAVYTSASAASVFVDNSPTPVGQTDRKGNYQLLVSAGSHQVRVEKTGFESPPTQTLTLVEKGQATARFVLKPTPVTPPLSQTAQVHPANTNPAAATAPTSQPAPVQPSAEAFIVVQAPAGAEIHIDQQLAGHSTGAPLRSKVQPGQRTVEVFLMGYQPFARIVTASAGKQEDLVATLTPVAVPSASPASPVPHNTSAVSDDDRKQIQQLLDRYADGYTQKNVKLIQTLWPSIPTDTVKTIKDFFKTAKSVDMKIRLTDAIPAGKRVTVECTQTLHYDLDGQPNEHTVPKTIYVVRSGTAWLIDFVPNS